MRLFLFAFSTFLICSVGLISRAHAQTDVVAFWHFEGFDVRDELDLIPEDIAGRIEVEADVDNTAGTAVLQAFLGDATALDGNGGGGFVPYTSPVSGESFGETRTIRFDDSRGGGQDFFIGDDPNNNTFLIDEGQGEGPVVDDFGNDALLYVLFDGTGFRDFQFRFDLEGTPNDPLDPDNQILPEDFNISYRITGPDGVFFLENNVELFQVGLPDELNENQRLNTGEGYFSLSSALDNASTIEIVINDFDGNDELEFDNFEIVATSIPEPSSASLLMLVCMGVASRRRR